MFKRILMALAAMLLLVGVAHAQEDARDQEPAEHEEQVHAGAERQTELPGRQPVGIRDGRHRHGPQPIELRRVARVGRAISSHARDRCATAAGRRPPTA